MEVVKKSGYRSWKLTSKGKKRSPEDRRGKVQTPYGKRLALVLFIKGLEPKEIADELGTRYGTIRRLLDSVYRNAKTSRRRDMIRKAAESDPTLAELLRLELFA